MYSRNRNSDNSKIDRRTLGGLYPVAKTYAERAQEDAQREDRFYRRQPKFVRLKIALYASVTLLLSLLFIQSIPLLWQSGNTSVIFFTFALALALFFIAFAVLGYTARMFYTFNRSFFLYLLAELVITVSILYVQPILHVFYFTPIYTTAIAHAIMLFVFLLLVIRYDRVL